MEERVIPGDFLALEEVYLPGYSTYEKEGKIYSKVLGKKQTNKDLRTVNVLGRYRRLLGVGDLVYAVVTRVRENLAFLSIASTLRQNTVINNKAGILLVKDLSNFYVDDLRNYLKIGDVVKARVKEVSAFSIKLETNRKDLGVVKGFCSRCRGEMERKGIALQCKICKNMEKRKVSFDYFD